MAPPTRRKPLATTTENAAVFDADFFRFSSPTWYILIITGMTSFWFVTFRPELFPFGVLGPFGPMLLALRQEKENEKSFQTMFKMACLLHIVEAFMAFRMCRQMKLTSAATLKWTGQTLLLGFASFGILMRYKTDIEQETKKKS